MTATREVERLARRLTPKQRACLAALVEAAESPGPRSLPARRDARGVEGEGFRRAVNLTTAEALSRRGLASVFVGRQLFGRAAAVTGLGREVAAEVARQAAAR